MTFDFIASVDKTNDIDKLGPTTAKFFKDISAEFCQNSSRFRPGINGHETPDYALSKRDFMKFLLSTFFYLKNRAEIDNIEPPGVPNSRFFPAVSQRRL